LEILFFDNLPSTQQYLVAQLQQKSLHSPVAVLSKEQHAGIGSRDNSWSGGEGNFFASIAIGIDRLPDDLPLASASIYFSFIMKETLEALGENIWLKWPNDFYSDTHKVGGTITQKVGQDLICGIGINLKKSQNGFVSLQSDISPENLLHKYIERLLEFPEWKQVFSQYEVEFELSKRFSVHIENRKKSLADASLCGDGSLLIGGKRVYSSR